MSVLRAVSSSSLVRCGVLLTKCRWSSSSTNFERKGWDNMYKRCADYNELCELRDKANFAKSSYLSSMDEKEQCWQLLHNSQQNLEEVHCKLDPLPVHDENYAKLISKEIALVKIIRSLSFDFNLHDKVTQDSLKSFTSTADQCLMAQVICEKKILGIYAIMSAVGIALGMLTVFTTFNLKEYLLKKDSKSSEGYEDLSEIISWILKQNTKLKGCFQDLRNVVGPNHNFSLENDFLSTIGASPNRSLEDSKADVVDILLQNKEMLKKMLAMEYFISSLKKFNKLPELIILKDLTVDENRGLWITTVTYGAVAIILPFIMLLQ